MNTNRRIVSERGRVLAALFVALLIFGLAIEFLLRADHGRWRPAYDLVCCGVIALFPFLLARLAPTAAGFDTQWLPSSRRHWIWFLGMLALSFVVKLLVVALAFITIGVPPETTGTLSTPVEVIFEAVAAVVAAPLAEEIFFRGFLLEQLTKLMRSSAAVLAQSFLFALTHLCTWGFDSLSLFNSLDAFLFGLIVGLWRIKFRSLLPIVLVHVLSNASGISLYVEAYERAVSQTSTVTAQSEKTIDAVELFERTGPFLRKGEHTLALRELEKVIELDPGFHVAHYVMGWVYATSVDQGCRDGDKALFHATEFATRHLPDPRGKESQWMAWACLAAAQAERGDFDKAIENQKKAMECVSTVSEEWRPHIEARVKACLNLYRARKPLRTKAISLGGLSDKWVESLLNPDPQGFPEIAE